jgi:hypothetical protein
MKYFLLIAAFAGAGISAEAQNKVSDYYPKLRTLEALRNSKRELTQFMQVHVAGCVSGDCQEGSGSFLLTSRVGDTTFPSVFDLEPVVRVFLYKGQFSDAGKKFEGTVYSRKVYYDIDYKKVNERADLIPKVQHDLRDDAFWKGFELGTGTMKYDGYVYEWNGWYDLPAPKSTPMAGQLLSARIYRTGNKSYVKTRYSQGGSYAEVEGRTLPDGELLGGRIIFSDKSVYEGFLYKGQRFGPGRFTGVDGKKEEGIWMLDSLAIKTAVYFPEELFRPGPTPAPTGKTYKIGKEEVSGLYSIGDGWVYIDRPYAQRGEQIYLGKEKDGKLTGLGLSYVQVFSQSTRINYGIYTGEFRDGQFYAGMRATEDQYLTPLAIKTSLGTRYRPYFGNIVQGFFNDGELTGECTRMYLTDTSGRIVKRLDGYITRFGVSGWIYVNDWAGKREAANLRYLVYGEDFLEKKYTKSDMSLVNNWTNEAAKRIWCHPEVFEQSAPLVEAIIRRRDSMQAVVNNDAAAEAAYKAASQKKRAECAAEAAKYRYTPGMLLSVGTGTVKDLVLITGPYNCDYASFPTVRRTQEFDKQNDGYFRASTGYTKPADLSGARPILGTYALCSGCKGSGLIWSNVQFSVGTSTTRVPYDAQVRIQCPGCDGYGFSK